MKEKTGLRLPTLTIQGFRAIKNLHLPDLGRVTLLVGRNGAGKSTVLEAVQLYASAGSPRVADDILRFRENFFVAEDQDGDFVNVPDHGSLFFGRGTPESEATIRIGCEESGSVLEVGFSRYERTELEKTPMEMFSSMMEGDFDSGFRCLAVNFGSKPGINRKLPFFVPTENREQRCYWPIHDLWPRRRYSGYWGIADSNDDVRAAQIPLQTMGPGIPLNEKIARWYEAVDMKPEEERVLEAMRFIEPSIERISVHMGQGKARHIMVKVSNVGHPLPLKGMGDGMVRLLGLALSLVNAKDGFLVIDEVENGVHHSLYPGLWNFVMRVAQDNNVQVIAVTHGWSCYVGFALTSLALSKDHIDGRLVRIERDGDEVRGVTYSAEMMAKAAELNLEVR